MLRLPVVAILTLSLMSTCFGQITSDKLVITSETKTMVDGVSELEQIGDFFFSSETTKVGFTQVGIVNVDNAPGKISIKATDASGNFVTYDVLDEDSIMFKKSGKYLIFVTAIDFENQDFIQEVQNVEFNLGPIPPGPVPPGPTPPTPPGPDDGVFDGLESRVRALASSISYPSRGKMESVLLTAASKMQTFEFKRTDQSKDYITRNWPPCENENCGKIWSLVAEDASRRNLGWSEIQSYYLTVAKGLR